MLVPFAPRGPSPRAAFDSPCASSRDSDPIRQRKLIRELTLADGDLTRNGNYLRWNVLPTYVSFRQPSVVLLHDEAGGVVEVRDVISGALMEIVQYPGLKPIRQSRTEGDMICLSSTGLAQIVEVSRVDHDGVWRGKADHPDGRAVMSTRVEAYSGQAC